MLNRQLGKKMEEQTCYVFISDKPYEVIVEFDALHEPVSAYAYKDEDMPSEFIGKSSHNELFVHLNNDFILTFYQDLRYQTED